MFLQVLVIAALLSGFVLLGLGVVGIRPNREIQWVPVDASSRGRFILLGVMLLLAGGWWYLEPPDTEIGTTQSLMPVDSAFTSGNSEISPNAVRPADEESEVPPKEPDAANAMPASPGAAENPPAAKPVPAAPVAEVAANPPATSSASLPNETPAPGDDLSPAAQALEQDRRAPKSVRVAADSSFVPSVTDEAAPGPAADAPAEPTSGAPAAAAPPAVKRSTASARACLAPAITIHVRDRLGVGQSGERLHLQIEGRAVAVLSLDESQPETAVAVRLPAPGRLRYRLTGYTDWKGRGRQPVDVEGSFLVRNGSQFEVQLLTPEAAQPQPSYASLR